MLEKTLESPSDFKEIKPVNPKGNQSWILIQRTDAELKLQCCSHLMQRTDIWKDPDAGKNWRQEEKGTTEDEMVGWHHWYNGHELGQTSREWSTRRPVELQSMGLQRVGHDLVTGWYQLGFGTKSWHPLKKTTFLWEITLGQLWALAEKKIIKHWPPSTMGPKLLVMNCLLSDPASHKTGCALKYSIIKWKWYIYDWAWVGQEGTDYIKK